MSIFMQTLSVIFYILLIILVIALIVLVLNAIQTLGKVDRLVDDVSRKSKKLDGVFTIIDNTTDAMVGFSDMIVSFTADRIGRIFKRKKENKHE